MLSDTRPTLLEQLRNAADAMAWDEFFQCYGRVIWRLAKRRNCSDHTAEEIVQNVLLKIFERREVFRYDPARGRFRDWLAAVVHNQLAEYRRRPSERVRAPGGSSAGAVVEAEQHAPQPDALSEAAFEESLLEILLDVLRREMNPRDYLAFELLALGGLPGAEVAKITGLSRNAAYKARQRAVARLTELGQPYRDDGQLDEQVRSALRSRPSAPVERSLTSCVEFSMRNRERSSRGGL